MTKEEALKLALEALKDFLNPLHTDLMLDINRVDQKTRLAITAIKEALEQPEPEPVIDKSAAVRIATSLGWEPKRKPLTDEEIILIVADCASSHQHTDIHFARAIETAHGIKE